MDEQKLTEVIRITKDCKAFLDKKKLIPRETYNNVLVRLLRGKN